MKKKAVIAILGVVLIILFLVGNVLNSNKTSETPTGTYREGMTYGGQNCIMFNDLLFWEQSIHDSTLPETMEFVGIVAKAVDAIPTHNFESAVTAEGSEIYYSDNNPGYLIVKEGDVYYAFSLQDNSFPTHDKVNKNISDAQIPHYITNQDYLIRITDNNSAFIDQQLKASGLDSFVMKIDSVVRQYKKTLITNIGFVFLQLLILAVLQCVSYLLKKRFLNDICVREITGWFVISWLVLICLVLFRRTFINTILVVSVIILLLLDVWTFRQSRDDKI